MQQSPLKLSVLQIPAALGAPDTRFCLSVHGDHCSAGAPLPCTRVCKDRPPALCQEAWVNVGPACGTPSLEGRGAALSAVQCLKKAAPYKRLQGFMVGRGGLGPSHHEGRVWGFSFCFSADSVTAMSLQPQEVLTPELTVPSRLEDHAVSRGVSRQLLRDAGQRTLDYTRGTPVGFPWGPGPSPLPSFPRASITRATPGPNRG